MRHSPEATRDRAPQGCTAKLNLAAKLNLTEKHGGRGAADPSRNSLLK